MKKLLNLGVSNPLTLGMAHPVADRLETLGRARPATWGSRALALSAMGVIALASAPLSIASDSSDHDTESHFETRYKFMSNFDGKKGQSYEIVTEDGVKKAYRILEGGKRKEVDLVQKDDGTYQMTYDDGQVIDLPNIDVESLKGLKGLSSLKKLEGLEGLAALKSLEGLEGLEGLKALESLKGIKLSGQNIQIFTSEDEEFSFSDDAESSGKFPERLREMLKSKDGSHQIKIITNGDKSTWFSEDGKLAEGFELDDTIVGTRFEFFQSSDPLETAQRQLERTKRQLESLSENENLSFDLNNALRDIESAQKSLEEAESRLLDGDK